MKPRDLANLLNRAAAAIETPGDLSTSDKLDLVNDLITEALEVETPKEVWKDDSVQFPRLLAEVQGVITSEQYAHLRESMDLETKDLEDLFDRAVEEWERIKRIRLG